MSNINLSRAQTKEGTLYFCPWRSRVCPGRYLGDNSLYAAVSNVLAVYNIKPPVDDAGNHIPLEANTTSGLLSSVILRPESPFAAIDQWSCHYRYFVPFKCVIEPRSSAALALIQRSESSL